MSVSAAMAMPLNKTGAVSKLVAMTINEQIMQTQYKSTDLKYGEKRSENPIQSLLWLRGSSECLSYLTKRKRSLLYHFATVRASTPLYSQRDA